jgi:hypothetical protein
LGLSPAAWCSAPRGYVVNHKKLHRLYREEKLALRKKSKQRLKCEKRCETRCGHSTGQADGAVTMDFIHDNWLMVGVSAL